MTLSTTIALVLLGLTTTFVLVLLIRAGILSDRGGSLLVFTALILAPALTTIVTGQAQMERSKQTEFCLSCHVMGEYGRSLYVDDGLSIPATHFQNNRVPRDRACYTCHTDYTMFGGVSAKLNGLRHLLVQYSGKIPDTLKLYSPYKNRECLQCHAGARAFEENEVHRMEPGQREDLAAERLSCLTSGCHDAIHDVHNLDDKAFWTESQ